MSLDDDHASSPASSTPATDLASDGPATDVRHAHVGNGVLDRKAELDAIAWNLPRPVPEPFPPDASWPADGAAA